jgi:uncharacterized protein
MEEMLLFVVRSLADHPDDVKVQFISDEEGDTFQVQANQVDLGRVIGKNGQTARALQAIVNANAMRNGHRYHLDIIEAGDDLDEE